MMAMFITTLDKPNVMIANGNVRTLIMLLIIPLNNRKNVPSIANTMYIFPPHGLLILNHSCGTYVLTTYNIIALAMTLLAKYVMMRSIFYFYLRKFWMIMSKGDICIHICLLISSFFLYYVVLYQMYLFFCLLYRYELRFCLLILQ